MAEHGEAGAELWADLELQLVADVGIVGVPNAGKSTLLGVVSAARPKVADYPFTTLVPNLGVCQLDFRTTVFADVPGLLEGAHTGRGLGHEFLRHCQRSRVLVHVVDGTSRDPLGDYCAIRTELELFNAALAVKPQVVAYNKVDVPDSGDYFEEVREALLGKGVAADDILAVSAATGQGVTPLVRRLHALLDALPAQVTPTPPAARKLDSSFSPQLGQFSGAARTRFWPRHGCVLPTQAGQEPPEAVRTTDAENVTAAPRRSTSDARIDEFEIVADLAGARTWTVTGTAIERFATMTNWDYYEAAARFQKVLDVAGISRALRARGVREGDTVMVGTAELTWSDDQSAGALYEAWREGRRARGNAMQGSARWPHAT